VRSLLFAAILIATAWPAAVRAEDIASYETEGDADAGGAEPRVAALDDAFSRAVTAALADLVDPEVRKTNKAALNQHILGHARLWVAKFTVTRDETADGRRQLTVLVRVDRDKVRDKLTELNIAAATGAPPPVPNARPIVVLLRTTDGTATHASYGASAEKEPPGFAALASALRSGGMIVKRAGAAGPAARATGDLPLEDDEADAFAADAKSELAAIAGVAIGAPVPIRGVAAPAVLVTAHVRVIARGKKLVGQGTASVAARGSEPGVVAAAIDRALVAAAGDIIPPARPALDKGQPLRGEDAPIGEPGVVLLRLAPRTPWGLVYAEQKYLSGARGIQRVMLRRVSPAGWVLGITTSEPIEKIMQIARKPPATDVTVKSSKIVGDLVEVTLGGPP
jgi:hypothetical protein